jgi:hypothetical protein
MVIENSVAEPYHFYAAPVIQLQLRLNDAVPAPQHCYKIPSIAELRKSFYFEIYLIITVCVNRVRQTVRGETNCFGGLCGGLPD